MVEELGLEKLLKEFDERPALTPLHRVILASTSTVQTMLSVIFMEKVVAKLIIQKSIGNVDVRWVRLVIEDTGQVVCLAESVIPHDTNHQEFIEELREGNPGGIGMIIARRKILTDRKILGIYVDENIFSRAYQLIGTGVDITIEEVFPKAVFVDAGVGIG